MPDTGLVPTMAMALGHQCHARYGIGTHDGNGIGGYRGEQERDACHEDDCYNGVQQIALHHIEIEEQRHKDNGDNRPDGDDFHRQVFLCAHHAGICLLAFHLFGGKPYGTLDDAPRARSTTRR